MRWRSIRSAAKSKTRLGVNRTSKITSCGPTSSDSEKTLRFFSIARFAAQLGFKPDAELLHVPATLMCRVWLQNGSDGKSGNLFTAPQAMNGVHVCCKIDLWSRIIDEIDFMQLALKSWIGTLAIPSQTPGLPHSFGHGRIGDLASHRISKDERQHALNRLDIHRKTASTCEPSCFWRYLGGAVRLLSMDDVSPRWASERGELVISAGIVQALYPHPSPTAAWNRASETRLFCPLMPLGFGTRSGLNGVSLVPFGASPPSHTCRATGWPDKYPEEAFELAKNELNGLMD